MKTIAHASEKAAEVFRGGQFLTKGHAEPAFLLVK